MNAIDDEATLLGIYLEDHVAGATAGQQRAARLADAEKESPDAAALSRFAADVDEDRDTLLALMDSWGFDQSRIKSGLASVGEKLGALKPNGRLTDRSPLSTIVELEAMQMAVRGKRSLWETLHAAMPASATQLEGLIARADDQLDVLSKIHSARVVTTFGALSKSELS